jgi:signal transduction histidine kinase
VKVRVFGLLLILGVGILPITVAGLIMIRRAEETALSEMRTGNQRVAERAASELRQFAQTRVDLLETLAAPLTGSAKTSPEQARRILKNYRILFPHIRELDVVGFGRGCKEAVTSRLEEELRDRCGQPAVETALAGRIYLGEIALTSEFAPVMTMGIPLEIAGTLIGAAVVEVDMVAIWSTVKQIRVGQTGFARLITRDGTLIAHGDPEELRRVFLREKDPLAGPIRAARPGEGARYRNSQGAEVIALSAAVPDLGWTVIVEQPVAEAFAAARAMQKSLVWTIVIAVILASILGLGLGGEPVRALESMRSHARRVAGGDLDSKVGRTPFLKEMGQLTDDLDFMTTELKRLNEEMAARERLNTFARVAAGLAHDLQTPIESVRTACDAMLHKPAEKSSRELLESATVSHLPRLHRYVRDLRRLAHDGKVPLEVVSVLPRLLVEKVVEDAAASPKWRGIEFVAEGEADSLWADESLLRRALGNLVANAADACVMRRPPSGRVTVRVANSSKEDALVVDIADTGVGIPADKLVEIMTHDFRSTKRNSGVGLGLGVARHVATSHGGSITAESVEGEGTTFRITIPRHAITGIAADTALRKGGHA